MSESPSKYRYDPTPTFEKQLAAIARKSPTRAKRIEEATQTILEDPYQKIDFGKGLYLGRRKWRVGKDRVIFVVCKQCRKLGHQRYNMCGDCEETPDENVIFATIVEGHKY